MRLITTLIVLALAQPLAAQQQREEQPEGPWITFEETSHDFGDIRQGDKVSYTFRFENTGTEPLIITNVQTTCGCTATEWPRESILPGEGGSIKVEFDSANKYGRQNKVITIVSNAVSPLNQVKIITNVLPPDGD